MFSILKTGKQMTVLTVGTGAEECEFLFSYQTFVAASIRGECFRTAEKFSVTTSRHVNGWLDSRKCAEIDKDVWATWRAEFVARYVQMCAPGLESNPTLEFVGCTSCGVVGTEEHRLGCETRPEFDLWEVHCGNIGIVHSGRNEQTARETFKVYVSGSERGIGRASGEDVTLWRAGEPAEEFCGELSAKGANS